MSNYSKYRKYILDLQRQLSFDSSSRIIKAKILDYIIRNDETDLWQIKKDIAEIFGPEYSAFTDQVFANYDGIISHVNENYKDLGIDINRNLPRIVSIEEIIKTRLGDYETREISEISRFTRKAIIEKMPVKELRRKLDSIGGRVANYSNTIARSQIAGYGRESKNTKAFIGGVVWAEYIGTNTKNTRLFCLEHTSNSSPRGDNHYHVDEINQMDNGPRQLKPVLTYCGGWNCNHDWEWDPFYKGEKK